MAGSLVQVEAIPEERDILDEPLSPQHAELRDQIDDAVQKTLDKGRRSRAAGWLRQRGLWSESQHLRTVKDFRCSVIGTTLRTDCQLEACRYHVDYKWSANCLLAYMHQQRVSSLSIDEIAFLWRIRPEHVKETIEQAVAKLRAAAIDVQAERDDYLKPRFRYLRGTRLCLVCESILEPDEVVPHNLQVENFGVYCSKECRDEKPPRVIELEAEKGLPIERILEWTFKRYRTLALAEQALQMPRWLVQEACQQYLGKPVDAYFPAIKQVQSQRRLALIRRTWHTPRWVDALRKKLSPLVLATQRRFGPATINTERLRRRLNRILESV